MAKGCVVGQLKYFSKALHAPTQNKPRQPLPCPWPWVSRLWDAFCDCSLAVGCEARLYEIGLRK
eukprot:scaffold1601_cov38-Cyclotella_meneghiniana.AAC.3